MNYSNVNPDYVWAYDLETASSDTAPKFHAKFSGEIKAPSNWKDEEKIKAHIEAKKAELGSKDALSWLTGKVVSFAMVNVGDVLKGEKKPRTHAFCGFDEKKVLQMAVDAINDQGNGVFQLVGKGNSRFDDGFFVGRMMMHDIAIPPIMKNSYNILDVDKMICSGFQTNQTASLAKYSFVLGLDAKLMNGGDVPRLYKDAVACKLTGDMAKVKEIMTSIKEYNIGDSVITATIAAKLLRQ